MLGGEQDCYGGCTDAGQGYYGLLDEVRPAKPSMYMFPNSWHAQGRPLPRDQF